MSDKSIVGSFTAATVTDENGEVVSNGGSWLDMDGAEITDPDVIARLEANSPQSRYERRQKVEMLENDDETWTPATVIVHQGAGTHLVRRENGTVIGVPADRLRAVDSED